MSDDPMIDEGEQSSGDPELIGARNPFVLAEHKLKEENIDWSKEEERKEKLQEAFDTPYEELFDPKYKGPLFVQYQQTGDLRPCIAIQNPEWGANPGGSNYTVGTRAYNDPVQGILPDCYFIAALSSLAFLNLIPGKQPPYTYTFYNPPDIVGGVPTPDTKPVVVTNNVPLDQSTDPHQYRYSKSFTAGEIWIAMYEKAFARWINRCLGTDSDQPDYSKICLGDPVVALMNLTGWKSSRFLTKSFTDGSKIYDKINTVCNTVGGYRVTTKPMVAYTYDPRIESNPSGKTYTDATIVGNHSYSVLGIHTLGTEKYIVMRNPWGQIGAGPGTGDPSLSGALATGPWYRITELADGSDAIFALKASVFKDYFKGFGWVSL